MFKTLVIRINQGYNSKKSGKEESILQHQDNSCFDRLIELQDIKFKKNNGAITYLGKTIDLSQYHGVIFSYNEDIVYLRSEQPIYQKLFKMRKFFSKQYPKIKIYNDPENYKIYASKIDFYQRVKDDIRIKKCVKIPDFWVIKNIQDLTDIIKDNDDIFPCFISYNIQSGGKNKIVCNSFDELKKSYHDLIIHEDYKQNNQQIFVSKVITSYHSALNSNLTVRWMVINDQLIDFYARPAPVDVINVNYYNQYKGDQLKHAHTYVETWLTKNRYTFHRFLRGMNYLMGSGFYSYDTVISEEGEIYIVEPGLKFLASNHLKLKDMRSATYDLLIFDQKKYLNAMIQIINQDLSHHQQSNF